MLKDDLNVIEAIAKVKLLAMDRKFWTVVSSVRTGVRPRQEVGLAQIA